MKMVYESPTHSNIQEKKMYNLIKKDMQNIFGQENILIDSVEKMAHKLPVKYEIDNEKTIPVLLRYSNEPSTISNESGIINKMTEPIYIMRLYAKEEIEKEAEDFVKQRMKDMVD